VVAKDKAGAATSFRLSSPAAPAFAALCYAEFASMVPVAGSAYTYAYATLANSSPGLSLDLLLEYGIGAASVAHGWSHYFVDFLHLLGVYLPAAFTNAPFDFNPASGGLSPPRRIIDAPALLISAVLTMILVTGIRRSARGSIFLWLYQASVVLLVIAIGVFYIDPANWRPSRRYGYSGISLFAKHDHGDAWDRAASRSASWPAAAIVSTLHRLDSVSTHAEEARNRAATCRSASRFAYPMHDLYIAVAAS